MKKFLNTILGKNPTVRFHRIVILLLISTLAVILMSGLRCGYSKNSGMYFHFGPSIDMNKVIEKKVSK